MISPVRLHPAVKDYLWGGNKLKESYNKQSQSEHIAESWELSVHNDGLCYANGGEYSGRTLKDLLLEHPEWLGRHDANNFPVLIKFIDAKDNLSVQVHPTNEAARAEGQQGKSEMWYVVEADVNAGIYCGFNRKMTTNLVISSVNEGKILDCLQFMSLKSGDAVYIPAGTVHAICGGMLIYEVQQSSSLTYRLYDYGRTDGNGKKRELHLDKAMSVIDCDSAVTACLRGSSGVRTLIDCDIFKVSEITGAYRGYVGVESFSVLTSLDGGIIISSGARTELAVGETVFLPAGMGAFDICGGSENRFLLTEPRIKI